jgi:hypothetical protein
MWVNLNCPNFLVGQGRCWGALEERCDRVLAVANETATRLGPKGIGVNDDFWSMTTFGAVLRLSWAPFEKQKRPWGIA